MANLIRFEGFIKEIISSNEFEYANGDSVTEDAKAFWEYYQKLRKDLTK